MSKYVVQMNFETDGDFSWDVVPAGFNVDLSEWSSGENYYFERVFYSDKELENWGKKYIPILKNNLSAIDDDIKMEVQNLLCILEENIKTKTTVGSYLYGNYSNTYVKLINNGDYTDVNFTIPNDIAAKMKKVNFGRDDFISGIEYILHKKEK